MSDEGFLSGALLRSVSRSFYLTIRLLPATVRGPIALAYLLARTSDTIADTSAVSTETRLRHLAAFASMLRGGSEEGLETLQREVIPRPAGERELLRELPACLLWLRRLDSFARHEIIAVLGKIIRGQQLDLERFRGAEGKVVALQSAGELEEYTYLVAGCVGEFWTRLCLERLRSYSAVSPEILTRHGTNFGKALQLTNILRDLPADLRDGRCYLPMPELTALGLTPESLLSRPAAARPLFLQWLGRAAELLEDGREYVTEIKPARLRAACFLPWHLAVHTLRLMRETPPLETSHRVKVTRGEVRYGLALACVAAFSDRPVAAAKHGARA